MSIPPILQKIKSLWLKIESTEILMVIIIILVGLAGFGLGILYEEGVDKTIKIENVNKEGSGEQLMKSSSQSLVGAKMSNILASKNGTKYYFSWCSGVGRILEENKIYFDSEEEATLAGYTKASGCR